MNAPLSPSTLVRNSIRHYWRTHLAVVLGVLVASAVLTGSLVVGDSMRFSLRELAVSHLGPVTDALQSPRFFRTELSDALSKATGFDARFATAVPLIKLPGGATHADTHARVERINVLGVDDRFWSADSTSPPTGWNQPPRRFLVLNQSLADALGAKQGDAVLIRVGKPANVSAESALGRKDNVTATLRLRVRAIVPNQGMGNFDLGLKQRTPFDAFVPIDAIQQSLDRKNRANTIIVAARAQNEPADVGWLQSAVADYLRLADVGLRVRLDTSRGYASLESERFLLEPPIEQAARQAADDVHAPPAQILAYLANKISMTKNGAARTIPYSTVAAVNDSTVTQFRLADNSTDPEPRSTTTDPQQGNDPDGALIRAATVRERSSFTEPAPLTTTNDRSRRERTIASRSDSAEHVENEQNAMGIRPGHLWLNAWAADHLGATVGDTVTLTYYVSGQFGALETRSHDFTLSAVISMTPAAVDPGFVPEYPGVTNADTLADWDAPFPVDLSLVRDKDEQYWRDHKTAPKAFVSLEDGQELWADDAQRLGQLTAVRVSPPQGRDTSEFATRFTDSILKHIDPVRLGLRFTPIRQQALAAGGGSTDFGGLFIGFSFFLIIAAAMLVALLFRLGVERRAKQIGLMLAVGITPRQAARLLVREGAILAVFGSAIGVPVALGYAWLMLAGLRSWWADAVNTPFLTLHTTPISLLLGFVISFLVAAASIAWAVRGLSKQPAARLLAGSTADSTRATSKRKPARTVVMIGVIVVGVILASVFAEEVVAFFVAGTGVLIALLLGVRLMLSARPRRFIHQPGATSMVLVGVRNIPRNASRSMLTFALMASAAFVIISLQAFRIQTQGHDTDKHSPSGALPLVAESSVNLLHDLNTDAGRESLNLSTETRTLLGDAHAYAFRLKPGDSASCLNLYLPTKPKIIGAADGFINRGGFVFSSSLAETSAESDNPWTLLRRRFDDGAVPAIGDEAAVKWQLHKGLGKDMTITDERGREVTLRFVALLKGSTLQDELIIDESHFKSLFPSVEGYGFFLFDVPAGSESAIGLALEEDLTDYAFDAELSAKRLADYVAVQNTYLSTFQTLGGFGLALGTIGLAAVMLRNVWERRGEFALMRAVGFSHRSIGAVVFAENAALVVVGLLVGVVPAGLAVLPHFINETADVPIVSTVVTISGVLVTGLLAGLVALVPALRLPLLASLRHE